MLAAGEDNRRQMHRTGVDVEGDSRWRAEILGPLGLAGVGCRWPRRGFVDRRRIVALVGEPNQSGVGTWNPAKERRQ